MGKYDKMSIEELAQEMIERDLIQEMIDDLEDDDLKTDYENHRW